MSSILKEGLRVLNLGPLAFYEDLRKQNVEAQQIDWTPPALSEDLEKELDRLL